MADAALSDGAVTIYGLVDPLTNQLRYVGKTRRGLVARLRHHINRARSTPDANLVSSWIAGLISNGLRPEIFDIEVVPHCEWQEAEKFWIAYWKYVGACLLNMTIGGGATEGHRHSGKTKSLLSRKTKEQFSSVEARSAHSIKTAEAMARPEVREKLVASLAPIHASEKYRRKQSETRRALWGTPEYRNKVVASQSLVNRTDIAKAFWLRPEYRERQAAARERRRERGSWVSDAQKIKQSIAVTGSKRDATFSEKARKRAKAAKRRQDGTFMPAADTD